MSGDLTLSLEIFNTVVDVDPAAAMAIALTEVAPRASRSKSRGRVTAFLTEKPPARRINRMSQPTGGAAGASKHHHDDDDDDDGVRPRGDGSRL